MTLPRPVLRPLPLDPACDLPDGSGLWVERTASPRVHQAAFVNATNRYTRLQLGATPPALCEAVAELRLISDALGPAGLYECVGGPTAADHVRTLLRARGRLAKIASHHSKQVDEHGGTDGYCAECGRRWPCPTYDWARETSDRDPAIDCWDRSDDFLLEDEEPSDV